MANDRIDHLLQERAQRITDMREILDLAEAESRDLSAEENAEYEEREKEVDGFDARLKRLRAQQARDLSIDDDPERRSFDARRALGGEDAVREAEQHANEYRDAFMGYIRGGINELEPEQRDVLRRGFTRMDDSGETRDMAKGTNSLGGFLVPVSFYKQLIQHLVQASTMRQTRATQFQTASGQDLQVPKTTVHGAANWVSEAGAIAATDETFAQVTLKAYKAVRLAKVAIELLQDEAIDLESFLGRELGRAIGALEGTGYVVGTGSGQPQGIQGVATLGVTTVAVAAVTADEIIDFFYSVPVQYRRDAEWMFADSTIKAVRKLKDTTNNYIWAPGSGGVAAVLSNPQPDTLLGRPIYDDPDLPAMATGVKFGIFGDLSAYWIRDVGNPGPLGDVKGMGAFAVRRLDERYADNLQVGFLAYHRTDGNLIDTTGAVKYVKNA